MNDQPISPLQSDTIRAALKTIAINVIALLTVFTGKAFDIDPINQIIDMGTPVFVSAFSIYYGIRTIQGRMKATATIKKEN